MLPLRLPLCIYFQRAEKKAFDQRHLHPFSGKFFFMSTARKAMRFQTFRFSLFSSLPKKMHIDIGGMRQWGINVRRQWIFSGTVNIVPWKHFSIYSKINLMRFLSSPSWKTMITHQLMNNNYGLWMARKTSWNF